MDLISWMAFFSRTMRDIAEFIGETDDAVAFTEIERATLDNIEGMSPRLQHVSCFPFSMCQCRVDLHWNEEQQMYCDANVNEDGSCISLATNSEGC